MNKRILWISAVVVTVLALSLDAFAQGGGGNRGGNRGNAGGGPGANAAAPGVGFGGMQIGTLLRNAEVVKLLNITEAQTTELGTALRPQGGQGGGANAGGGAPAQRTPAERRAQQETQWASVAKVLNAEQMKKFKDIYFQANVPVANPNAPAGAPAPQMNLNVFVLGALDLTADQKEKINKILDDAAAAAPARPAQGASQEEMTAFRTAARERSTKTNDAVKAVLTDAQKKKMEELTAGAAKVRTDLNLNQGQGQRGQGQGGQGGGRGNAGGGAGGNTTYTPGAQSWQPGQAAPATGGNRAGRGNFPRNNANAGN